VGGVGVAAALCGGDARLAAAFSFAAAAAAAGAAAEGAGAALPAAALLRCLARAPPAVGGADEDAGAARAMLQCAEDTAAALAAPVGAGAVLVAEAPRAAAAAHEPQGNILAAAAYVPRGLAEAPLHPAAFPSAPSLGLAALALPSARLLVYAEEEEEEEDKEGGGDGAVPAALFAAHRKWRLRLAAALGWRVAVVSRAEALQLTPRALARLFVARSAAAPR
jgi:hypothetical protein